MVSGVVTGMFSSVWADSFRSAIRSPRSDELLPVKDLARLGEHLALFFLDMVLDVLLHHHGLGAPSLVATSMPSSSPISTSTT